MRKRFLHQCRGLGAVTGFSLTHRLTESGNTVGIGLGIAGFGRFHGVLIGCNYCKYGKFSPGLLMYDSIMADWLNAGGEMFDFNVGDASYKEKFGTNAVPISSFGSAMTFGGRLAGSLGSARRHLRKARGEIIGRRNQKSAAAKRARAIR